MQRLGDNPANRKPMFGEAAAESTRKKGKFITQTISDRFLFSKVFQDVTALNTWASLLPKSGVLQKKQKISYMSLQLLWQWQSHSLAVSIQLLMKLSFYYDVKVWQLKSTPFCCSYWDGGDLWQTSFRYT